MWPEANGEDKGRVETLALELAAHDVSEKWEGKANDARPTHFARNQWITLLALATE